MQKKPKRIAGALSNLNLDGLAPTNAAPKPPPLSAPAPSVNAPKPPPLTTRNPTTTKQENIFSVYNNTAD